MARTGFISVSSGRLVNVLDLQASDVVIEDIASSLSKQCRFAGHTREFYSVAQHCVRVAMAVPPEYMLEGLLHDAAECYLVDLPRPLKQALPEYKIIEELAHLAISFRFGLPGEVSKVVKEADESALLTEYLELMPLEDPAAGTHGPFTAEEVKQAWFPGVKELPRTKVFMTPQEAEGAFLITFANAIGAKLSGWMQRDPKVA